MAFTYVLTTDRGKVRFLSGDTDSLDILLQDDEIDYLLTLYPSVTTAAVAACRAIAAKFAREADKSIGDLSISFSQRASAFYLLATQVIANSSVVLSPYCGGISKTDKALVESDGDRVLPAFIRGMQSSDFLIISSEE